MKYRVPSSKSQGKATYFIANFMAFSYSLRMINTCLACEEGPGGVGIRGKDCLGVEPSQSLRATGRLTAAG